MSYVKGTLWLVFFYLIIIIQVEPFELEPSSLLQTSNRKVCQRDEALCKLCMESSLKQYYFFSSILCLYFDMELYKTTAVWVTHAC